MPDHRSAHKHARSDAKRRARNRSRMAAVRSAEKNVQTTSDPESAQSAYREASSQLDRAAKRGLIHRKTANRKKSRLSRRVNKIQEEQATS